jgi:hypothetical protein
MTGPGEFGSGPTPAGLRAGARPTGRSGGLNNPALLPGLGQFLLPSQAQAPLTHGAMRLRG